MNKNDDYLWDGKGPPDADVRDVEERLRRFRHDPAVARREKLEREFLAPIPAPRLRRRPMAAWTATAAALLGAVVLFRLATRPPSAGWEVVRLDGAPTVASAAIGHSARLAVGARLETDAASRARIRIGAIGEAEVEPNSRVRLVRADLTDNRLALERGAIRARIWAPPRLFFVETPSATAVDLGCAYTLQVDDAGRGLLRVLNGWVAFDSGDRESFVPEGAMCETRPGTGPGTPWFADASASFRGALEQLDFGNGEPAAREAALEALLAQARVRDALTLWHLLSRVEAGERGRLYDRLAALVPPPQGTTRELVLSGDRRALDLWWDRLGYGVTTWWRLWKSPGLPA